MLIINDAPKLVEINLGGNFIRLMPDEAVEIPDEVVESGRFDSAFARGVLRAEDYRKHQKIMKRIESKQKTRRWYDGKKKGDLEKGEDSL